MRCDRSFWWGIANVWCNIIEKDTQSVCMLYIIRQILHWHWGNHTMPWTPDIFSLADAAWKHPKYPCFCILPLEFEVSIDIHKHENSEVLCPNCNLQRKCLGTPDCKYIKKTNMLIDFIWPNVQAKYVIQIILYHFKWDMTPWKWPKCPQYMQRTWWQTVATQHTGLT